MKVLALVIGAVATSAYASEPASISEIAEGVAWGISPDGNTVVGELSLLVDGARPSFAWSEADGLMDLGLLGDGPRRSNANDVALGGQTIVGGSSRWSPTRNEAFVWRPQTGMVGLGFLGVYPSPYSEAYAISANGQVVVGRSTADTSSYRAFRWTEAEGMSEVLPLPVGFTESFAFGVSADAGVVVGSVGFRVSTNLRSEAAVWEGSTVELLGHLNPDDYLSAATAVSEDGQVVVGYSRSASGNSAFRWTPGGGLEYLGDLPGGAVSSTAYAVSADGSVIVGESESALGVEAFIWDSDSGMRRLRDVLACQCVDLDGWELVSARGLSSDGAMMSGYGSRFGGTLFVAWHVNLGPIQPADLDANRCLNIDDIDIFVTGFLAGDLTVDQNGDAVLNIDDIDVLVSQFLQACS